MIQAAKFQNTERKPSHVLISPRRIDLWSTTIENLARYSKPILPFRYPHSPILNNHRNDIGDNVRPYDAKISPPSVILGIVGRQVDICIFNLAEIAVAHCIGVQQIPICPREVFRYVATSLTFRRAEGGELMLTHVASTLATPVDRIAETQYENGETLNRKIQKRCI